MTPYQRLLLPSILFLLGACSPATQPGVDKVQPRAISTPKRVTVGEADRGRSVTLNVGDTLAVVLPSNSGTGYSWEITKLPKGLLERAGDVQTVPETALLGAGGQDLFLFNAVGRGRAEVRLVYRRPFEQAGTEATFEIAVLVD